MYYGLAVASPCRDDQKQDGGSNQCISNWDHVSSDYLLDSRTTSNLQQLIPQGNVGDYFDSFERSTNNCNSGEKEWQLGCLDAAF